MSTATPGSRSDVPDDEVAACSARYGAARAGRVGSTGSPARGPELEGRLQRFDRRREVSRADRRRLGALNVPYSHTRNQGAAPLGTRRAAVFIRSAGRKKTPRARFRAVASGRGQPGSGTRTDLGSGAHGELGAYPCGHIRLNWTRTARCCTSDGHPTHRFAYPSCDGSPQEVRSGLALGTIGRRVHHPVFFSATLRGAMLPLAVALVVPALCAGPADAFTRIVRGDMIASQGDGMVNDTFPQTAP